MPLQSTKNAINPAGTANLKKEQETLLLGICGKHLIIQKFHGSKNALRKLVVQSIPAEYVKSQQEAYNMVRDITSLLIERHFVELSFNEGKAMLFKYNKDRIEGFCTKHEEMLTKEIDSIQRKRAVAMFNMLLQNPGFQQFAEKDQIETIAYNEAGELVIEMKDKTRYALIVHEGNFFVKTYKYFLDVEKIQISKVSIEEKTN